MADFQSTAHLRRHERDHENGHREITLVKSSVRNFCFLIAITFLCCAKANAASATLACFEEKENAQKLVDKTEFNEEKEELEHQRKNAHFQLPSVTFEELKVLYGEPVDCELFSDKYFCWKAIQRISKSPIQYNRDDKFCVQTFQVWLLTHFAVEINSQSEITERKIQTEQSS